MRFTAKTEYAVRAAIEIGLLGQERPAQVKEIASRQAIPERFLEQVMASLKKAGIIESIRGAQGGYRLAKPIEQITLTNIIEAIEGPMLVMECLSEDLENVKCNKSSHMCSVRDVWKGVQGTLSQALDSITLDKLIMDYRGQAKADKLTAG